MKKLFYLFLTVAFIGCSSDDSGNNSNSLDVSWQVTVGGQTYENSSVSGSGLFSSDCNETAAFEAYFPEIDTATRFYSADILHNNLTSDFDGTSVGSYPIKGDYLDSDCNLTLSVTLSDYGSPVLSNGMHNVTSINQISSSNNETIWSIEGNFSGTYSDQFNNDLETVSITGSYRNVLYTYQD
jgi:hypothetical protein